VHGAGHDSSRRAAAAEQVEREERQQSDRLRGAGQGTASPNAIPRSTSASVPVASPATVAAGWTTRGMP
jgi:hypothetical protein